MEVRELRKRVRELLKVAKELKRRGIVFEIVGADLSQYEPGNCINGGGYAYYKIIKVKPRRTPYYIYSTSSEFSFCPLEGSFCGCGMGIKENEDCFRRAEKENKIRLTVKRLTSALECYSDELSIRVRYYYELDEDTKEWLWSLGFLYDEMHF